jgi:L-2-hydroxyglutarate oxidase LhgO
VGYDVDTIVIGAGVVGLACAAALAREGDSLLVLEAERAIGTGISSRNSEVAHAGIYYPTGSLKHLACVEGRRALYPFLVSRGVRHVKCGKLIVATDDAEETRLARIHALARENGVEGVELITSRAARAMEPELHCVAALWSPETGIIDSHGYMLALQGELEDAGGVVAFGARVERIEFLAHGFAVHTSGRDAARVTCAHLVNSAGLHAQSLAARMEGFPAEHIPPLRLCKGSYFGCAGRPVFSRLIYPAPVEGGLGVHVTLDLAGCMRFGPDVEWLPSDDPDAIDYAVDARRADDFYEAVRRYWPGLSDGAITPHYSGCRPKITGPGEPAADFRLDGPDAHGVPGLVNLFGIESPGLTSSLALARRVAGELRGHGQTKLNHVETQSVR